MAEVAHYESLTGAAGKQIFYRPQRFAARELFKQVTPNLHIDYAPYALADLSISGLAAYTTSRDLPAAEPGDDVSVIIHLADTVLYRGRGRVCRVEPFHARSKVALALTTGHVDIGRAVVDYQAAFFKLSIDRGLAQHDELVSGEYRQFCADILHFLRRYRAVLDRLETDLQSGGDSYDGHAGRALALCEERALPEWRKLWVRGNRLVEPIMHDEAALKATKDYTTLVVTPDAIEGPVIRRSFEKPLGYPGDYEIMNSIYRWQYEGGTLFAKFVHRLGLDVAECIAARMVMLQQTIGQMIASAPPGQTTRITNLACGPAQEVTNCLKIGALPGPVHFTLIDQDRAALDYAYQQAYPEIMRHQDHASVQCLHVSFSQLMRAGRLFRRLPTQHLIYSVGLFDYIATDRARAMVADLYGQLEEGGLLAVGNMRQTESSCLWPLEFIADWSLIYRTEAEMYDLTADLDAAAVEVRPDPTGRIQVLYIRKPKRRN